MKYMERSLIVACALLLCSCGTPRPLDLVAMPGEGRISAADRVHVAISKADRTRLDPVFLLGRSKQSAETGAIWFQVFTGREGDPQFTIKSAKLEYETLVLAARVAYTVEGELTHQGHAYRIRARGARTAAMAIGSASRQAVELGVADAARQCREIIAGKRN